MDFLLLLSESRVLVQLAEWNSIADPPFTGDILTPTWYMAPHSVFTTPVASLRSEDLLVPTSGDKDDGDDTTPADGKDRFPTAVGNEVYVTSLSSSPGNTTDPLMKSASTLILSNLITIPDFLDQMF